MTEYTVYLMFQWPPGTSFWLQYFVYAASATEAATKALDSNFSQKIMRVSVHRAPVADFRVEVIGGGPGGEWQVEGVEPTTSVETIDFSQPLIHYVTQDGDGVRLQPIRLSPG